MRNTLFILLAISALISCSQKQDEVAQWRGENRDGIYDEGSLASSWPDEGPDLLWSVEGIGNGYGAPSVTSEAVFVNGEIDSLSYLQAFSTAGELLWKVENGKGYVGKDFSAQFPGSRSAPTVLGKYVYTNSSLGRLACFDTETAAEIWSVDMLKDFNGTLLAFGYAESPLINDDMVYCYPGGATNFAVGLNRFTGEIIWRQTEIKDSSTYNSPILFSVGDRKILANFSNRNLVALDPLNGQLLFTHRQEKRKFDQMCNTPIFYKNYLYYYQSDGNDGIKLKIADDGTSYEEIWRNDVGRNLFYGFVIHNDKMYICNEKNHFFAVDLETGIPNDTMKIKTGSGIVADDKLYFYSNNGTVSLIDIAGDKMKLVSEFTVKEGTKQHFSRPVIKNGVLYIRRGDALMAYDISEK